VFNSTATLLGIVFLGFFVLVIVLRIVRRSRSQRPDPPMNVDFSMADLHEMHEKGLVSAEEFERLRQAVLLRAQARQAMQRPPGAAGFQVIQNPPPLPPLAPEAPPAPPVTPDDSSRDAR